MRPDKTFLFLVCTTVILFTNGSAVATNSDQTTRRTQYAAGIDDIIAHCANKEAMLAQTKSDHLRQACALGCLKAAYLRGHKEMLIEELLVHQTGTKPHQIQYYLNSKFLSILRAAAGPPLPVFTRTD